ncbi:MAG: hypothetical protein LWY06_20415 [Firmicutes bacterium]|nr:hypothetical protein [Bacillota bacterium]
MSSEFRTTAAILLAVLFAVSMTAGLMAQEKDPNLHGVKFIYQSRPVMATATKNEYVSSKFLAEFFDVEIVPAAGGRALKVGGVYYGKDQLSYKGETYVRASTFLRFFDVGYAQANQWTYDVKESSLPMFDTALYRAQNNAKIKIGSNDGTADIVMIKRRKFIALDDAAKVAGLSESAVDTSGSSSGIIKLNGKMVDRWIEHNDKVYGLTEDLTTVLGKTVQ